MQTMIKIPFMQQNPNPTLGQDLENRIGILHVPLDYFDSPEQLLEIMSDFLVLKATLLEYDCIEYHVLSSLFPKADVDNPPVYRLEIIKDGEKFKEWQVTKA